MNLTVFYDGQFWIGIIEWIEDDTLKALRYFFGSEPKDSEVLEFVNQDLHHFISGHKQQGIRIFHHERKKLNPKRMQRLVSKEIHKKGISTKAEEAIKQELEGRKKETRERKKERREEFKRKKYALKKQKAKDKHRGK